MRSSITSVLIAGAFVLAGATSATYAAEHEVNVAADSHGATIDYYKAEREKCKQLPGSDQARCMDQVGVTTYGGDREGTVTEEMGSSPGSEKCEALSPEDRRDCLLSSGGK